MHPSRSNFLYGSKRAAKLKRLKAKGLLPTKAELAKLCANATATLAPTKCPDGEHLDTRTIRSVNPERAQQIIKALR